MQGLREGGCGGSCDNGRCCRCGRGKVKITAGSAFAGGITQVESSENCLFLCLVYVFRRTIDERESSFTQVRDKLSVLQTQVAIIQAALAESSDADASAVDRVQELKWSLLSVRKDLCDVQAQRRTLRAKESQLIDILKSLEGQVVVFCAEPLVAQVELADLTSQCDGACGRVNTLTAARDAAAAREVMEIGNRLATEGARDSLSRDVTTARR